MIDTKRAKVLLRAAYDMMTRNDRRSYDQEFASELAHYDGTDWDGSCLRNEIADELGIDSETAPIPLDDKERE